MQRFLCGLLVCFVVLTGCRSATKKTATPAAPDHNVPGVVYPGPNTQGADQTSQPYPAPPGNDAANPTGEPYPAPGTSSVQTPTIDEYAPTAGDENMTRGNALVTIKDSSVVLMESSPVQVKLHLKGTLPDPCYHLRVNPAQPDDQKRIQVEAYSVAKPGQVCTDELQDFDVEIPLGSFTSGHYTVYINGEFLGEFDA